MFLIEKIDGKWLDVLKILEEDSGNHKATVGSRIDIIFLCFNLFCRPSYGDPGAQNHKILNKETSCQWRERCMVFAMFRILVFSKPDFPRLSVFEPKSYFLWLYVGSFISSIVKYNKFVRNIILWFSCFANLKVIFILKRYFHAELFKGVSE